MTAPRVVIIGGSLGGLFAANLLWRAGCDVTVYERVPGELTGRGAGIVTHPELHDALRQAGVDDDEDALGLKVPGRVTVSREGRVIAEQAMPQIVMSWGRLYGLLRNVLPDACYVAGAEFTRLEQDQNEVRAYLSDGRMHAADVLIAADGARSTVRAQLWPDVKPVYAGYVGWRGLVEEADFSPETHAALFERFAFLLPPGEQALGYPVTGPDDALEPGRRRYNFVWYRPVEETRELPRLLTDATGRYHPDGIPPPLIRREVHDELKRAAEALLSPGFAEVVRTARQLFFQAIVDLDSPRLALGRVALLGDAAFVARPHCGMGVTKAAGDAVALSRALEAEPRDVSTALARYETERLRFGHFIVDHARRLGSFMKTTFTSPEERQLAETYSTPSVIMREFAVPPALPWVA